MSVKLFIDVDSAPCFSDRVDVAFDLNKRPKNNPTLKLNDDTKLWEVPPPDFFTYKKEYRYWYEDEWFDGNLGELAGYGGSKRYDIWEEFESEWDFTKRKQFLKDLSEIPDETIFDYLNNLWYRPNPYWKMYRIITKDYLLAKRDYLNSLVDANITDIHIMAVYIPPSMIHKKYKQHKKR